jgi:hypothetical protein
VRSAADLISRITERRAPPWTTALSLGEVTRLAERYSGCTTTAGSEFANVVEEDGPLQIVELRGVHRNLSEEGIGHEDRSLVAMACVGVAQQGGDVDLKSTGEAIERRERRHSLAILDLRDVGAWDAHAGSELPLR